jgi:hypothetical protein
MSYRRRRPTTPLDRLLGARRARRLRRRLGWLLIGAGVASLRPRVRAGTVAAWVTAGALAAVLLGRVLPI